VWSEETTLTRSVIVGRAVVLALAPVPVVAFSRRPPVRCL